MIRLTDLENEFSKGSRFCIPTEDDLHNPDQ